MDIQQIANRAEVFLLDMDGTIYFDETPIGDMKNTLAALRRAGKKLVYFTNNSSKTPDEYVTKLKKIGFWEEADMVYTSAMATAEYLRDFYSDKRVYVVATDAVKKSFADHGVQVVEEKPDVCVLAYDTTLTFEKLKKINKYIVEGALYIATHPDDVCPSKDVFPPDVGSFIALLKVSSGKSPDLICGKPYTTMGDCIKRKLKVESDQVVMVGDRLHTDIRFGVNNGFHTILVMSGETTEEIRKTSPDHAEAVLPSLNEITEYLK
jgi:HAD superfamily hydrolase (TIGR01450 family)